MSFTAHKSIAPFARALALACMLTGLGSVSFAQEEGAKPAEVASDSEVHEAQDASDDSAEHGDAEHGSGGESHASTDEGHDDHAEGHGDKEEHGDDHAGDHGAGHDGHGDGHDEHGEGHSGAHHDPFDLSTANATESLEAVEEIRADLALWTVAVFALLLAILAKFAWGPICEALDKREQGIADQIDEAQRNQEEARRLLAEHEEKVAKASEEVREMLDQARRDAETQKASILADAEAAAKAEKDRAVREIHAAKNNALEQLAESSVDQALGLAGSIVGQKLEKQDHARLIQEALKQIPSEN